MKYDILFSTKRLVFDNRIEAAGAQNPENTDINNMSPRKLIEKIEGMRDEIKNIATLNGEKIRRINGMMTDIKKRISDVKDIYKNDPSMQELIGKIEQEVEDMEKDLKGMGRSENEQSTTVKNTTGVNEAPTPSPSGIHNYKEGLERFVSALDLHVKSYMHPVIKQGLLHDFPENFEEGDGGYPIKTIIDGEKWYVSDKSMDDTKERTRMISQVRNDTKMTRAEKERLLKNLSDLDRNAYANDIELTLIKADNPAIQSNIWRNVLKKNPAQLLRETIGKAKREWESQESGKDTLHGVDLPKNTTTTYLSIFPSNIDPSNPNKKNDPVTENSVHHASMLPHLLREKGYNVNSSGPIFTDTPEKVIEDKVKEIDPTPAQKTPRRSIMLNLFSHGRETGMVFGTPQIVANNMDKAIALRKMAQYYDEFNKDEGKIIAQFRKDGIDLSDERIRWNIAEYVRYDSAFAASGETDDVLFRAEELIEICKRHPNVDFIIMSAACHGGGFSEPFEKAQLPNVTLSLATKPDTVAQVATIIDSSGEEKREQISYQQLFQYAVMYLGENLKIPSIVDGKVVQKDGKVVMVDMRIETIGDAMRYADLMNPFKGSYDDPEFIVRGTLIK